MNWMNSEKEYIVISNSINKVAILGGFVFA